MRNALEKYLTSKWYSDKAIVWLKPLAYLYKKIITARRKKYLLKTSHYNSPWPVAVIGNIVVGGTGKTPLIITIANKLTEHGIKAAIISRGYGANISTNTLVAEEDSFEKVGDEPLLVAKKTRRPVVIGSDRVKSIELLKSSDYEIDIVLMDDGLQNYSLKKDLEIMVFDGNRLFGNGELLPAGPLREPVERIYEADLVLVNGSSHDDFPVKHLKFELSGKILINLDSREEINVSEFSGNEVYAYAGIGNPERFFSALKQHGMMVEGFPLGDHQTMPNQFFAEHQDKPIIITEKDAVKISSEVLLSHNNIWSLPVTVSMSEADTSVLMSGIVNLVKKENIKENIQ